MNDLYSSYTNLSRSLSLTILDGNEKEIKIKTDQNNRIEFFIPRDPNLPIPPMFLQNVTSMNRMDLLFNYHLINLTQSYLNLTYSIHLELHPLNINRSYFLMAKFDDRPKLHSMDNWTIFCPSG